MGGIEVLSREEILKNRNEIIELLKSTNRKGIHKVIYFLDHSGYFWLYGSFKHHTYKGGLAEHSLGVCKNALKHSDGCSRESVIIAGLLHDICKTKYEFPEEVKDEYANGHGSKSVKIIENFIKFELTDEERRAIRFHMKQSGRHYDFDEEWELAKNERLRSIIHTADCFDAGDYSDSMYPLIRLFAN